MLRKAGRMLHAAFANSDERATPAFGTLATLAGLISGLLGSLYSLEIRTGFETVSEWFTPSLWNPPVVGFWVCVLFAARLFFLHQRAVDDRRERAHDALERQTASIPDFIRTHPPAAFLKAANKVYETCGELTRLLLVADKAKTADIRGNIQKILEGFAILAEKFDDCDNADKFYSANLFLFITPQQAKVHNIRPKFTYENIDLSTLRGQLYLCETFQFPAEAKDKVQPLSLPVPVKLGGPRSQTCSGWEPLPGAPLAFCRGQFEYFANTSTMADWYKDNGNYSNSIERELRQHFSDHNVIFTSFLSIPIYLPEIDDVSPENRHFVGVVNVHWRRGRKLELAEPASNFAEATFPLQLTLGTLLRVLDVEAILAEEFGTPGHEARIGEMGRVP